MLGETIFSLDVGELMLSKTVYEPGMVMGAHVHELPYVSLVVAGRYTEHRRDGPCQLHREMLVFHPAGEEHADFVHDTSMATVNIEYRSKHLPLSFLRMQGPEVEALTRGVLSSVGRPESQLRQAIEAIDAFLWSRAPRAEPSEQMLLARRALLDNEKLSVSETARELGIHRVALHRMFRRTYGESPRAGLTKRRLAAAAILLTTTSAGIAEIAAECGYYDQSHFCRQFKGLTGMSPSRYRLAFAA